MSGTAEKKKNRAKRKSFALPPEDNVGCFSAVINDNRIEKSARNVKKRRRKGREKKKTDGEKNDEFAK